MKTALIVSPYLDHLGGGERYMLSCALALENLGYAVRYGWDDQASLQTISRQLGLTLKLPVLDPEILKLYHSRSPFAMYRATRPYDVVVYLSDGSIPLLGGRVNILHMQVPFHRVGGQNWKNKIKKHTINHVIVNSNFTKKIVDQEYDISSTVLYPPVPPVNSTTKAKVILSVGRFERSLNVKKHDIMIKAFRKLSPFLPGWRLKLVGGATEDQWLNQLRALAESYPIDILPNVPYETLMSHYGEAHLYWHAAGYGVDETTNPELLEHFGISTVEAITARAIPLVYGGGGQTEIVKNPDLLWQNPDELVAKTKVLVTKNFADYEQDLPVTQYSLQAFSQHFSQLL